MGTNMSCFNMSFRVHANNEADRLQNRNSKIMTNLYMDLQFYVSMFYYYIIMNNVCYLCLAGLFFSLQTLASPNSLLTKEKKKQLGETCACWPHMNYVASRCRFVRLLFFDLFLHASVLLLYCNPNHFTSLSPMVSCPFINIYDLCARPRG